MKIVLGCKLTGECVSVCEINSKTVKALKKWITNQFVEFPETEIIIAKSVDLNLKREFEDYIESFMQEPRKKIVGVFTKRLKDFCYQVNDIRPLHICQSLYFNILNTEFAYKSGDFKRKQELLNKRIELYKEMKEKFGLNMIETNQLMWEEYGQRNYWL